VQSGAAQLNRLIKAGTNTGAPKGYHMHADGSLHKNGDGD
jgi:membrane fusion protein, heavy metal efflux system